MSRVFVIGLDGAAWAVLRPAFEADRLPTLRSLFDEAGWGPLRSTFPPVTPPAWTSFITGVNPGAHGVFSFRGRHDQSYRGVPVSAADRRHPTLLGRLSANGHRVAAVTIPFTYPPETLADGCMVSGFGLPASRKEAVTPPGLFSEIAGSIGRIPTWPVPPSTPGYLEKTGQDIARRFRIGELVFRRYDPDVFLLVVSETDHAAHYFWDSEAPPETLLKVYERVDQEIGRLFEQFLEPDDAVLVMSDHGTGPGRGLRIHTNALLMELGLLAPKGRWSTSPIHGVLRGTRSALEKGFPGISRKLRTLSPRAVTRVVSRQLHDSAVDWSRTVAYYPSYGAVRINLRGREPTGVIHPREYKRVREEVRQALLSLTGPEGGVLFSDVLTGEQLFEGPFLAEAPDLLPVDMDPGYDTISSFDLSLPKFAAPDRRRPQPESMGTHRQEGVYILRDPQLRHPPSGETVDIADILPAVLGGRSLLPLDGSLVQRWYGPTHSPVSVPTPPASASEQLELSESEQAEVEEHLRSLGYVE